MCQKLILKENSSSVRVIGDVHGKYNRYKRVIENCDFSIQLGDMGVGFRRLQGPNVGQIYGNPPFYKMDPNHFFIRGNHDNPSECRKHSLYIEDGFVLGNIMFIGGAASNDKEYRVKDYSWWSDEEVSVDSFETLLLKYSEVKPEIMLTHQAPEDVIRNFYPSYSPQRTPRYFQQMLNLHSPKLWIFGHHHRSMDFISKTYSTRFICLDELEFIDININSARPLKDEEHEHGT